MSFTIRTWHREAIDERIAREAVRTTTDRTVIYNLALSVTTASADARVHALLIHARLARSTLRIYQALWSTIWRSADELGQAGADGLAVIAGTLAVRSARGGFAWFTILFGG